MALIRFTANYDDLSTDRGYQFRFHCDKCSNGFMTRFQTSVTGVAGDLLRAAGNIFGGILSSAGNSAYDIQRAVGGKAHDDAFADGSETVSLEAIRQVADLSWIAMSRLPGEYVSSG